MFGERGHRVRIKTRPDAKDFDDETRVDGRGILNALISVQLSSVESSTTHALIERIERVIDEDPHLKKIRAQSLTDTEGVVGRDIARRFAMKDESDRPGS